jgi:hypothetical protein
MTHIYAGAVARVKGLVKRNGLFTVLAKPIRVAFAPLIIARLPNRIFELQGSRYSYFFHSYNTTWINERCVEIPFVRNEIENVPSNSILEVGNVLNHYHRMSHEVLDKYELGKNVINQDVCDFTPVNRYDRIVSISTFEHIGFDDHSDGTSAGKIQHALEKTRSWLRPGGRFIMTATLGYNQGFDDLVRQGLCHGSSLLFMKRVGRSEWRECSGGDVLNAKYSQPFPYGNALVIAIISASGDVR